MNIRNLNIGVVLPIVAALVVGAAVVALLNQPRAATTWMTRAHLQLDLDEKTWDHDRGHITYFQGGDGPPLVFVHGIADQAGSWSRIAGQFTDDYTVVALDLPDHGDSLYTGDDTLGDESLKITFEFLDEHLDEPAIVVGNSLGGWVALLYALERPDNVDRLVPTASGGLEHEIDPSLLMPENRTEARRTIRTIFGEDSPPVPGFVLDRIVERSSNSVVADAFENQDDAEYLDDRLPNLAVRADLVWGTEDLIFPMDYAERMDAKIPDSELHVIDGCGHSPQVGCPDEFVELLDDILADPAPR